MFGMLSFVAVTSEGRRGHASNFDRMVLLIIQVLNLETNCVTFVLYLKIKKVTYRQKLAILLTVPNDLFPLKNLLLPQYSR